MYKCMYVCINVCTYVCVMSLALYFVCTYVPLNVGLCVYRLYMQVSLHMYVRISVVVTCDILCTYVQYVHLSLCVEGGGAYILALLCRSDVTQTVCKLIANGKCIQPSPHEGYSHIGWASRTSCRVTVDLASASPVEWTTTTLWMTRGCL